MLLSFQTWRDFSSQNLILKFLIIVTLLLFLSAGSNVFFDILLSSSSWLQNSKEVNCRSAITCYRWKLWGSFPVISPWSQNIRDFSQNWAFLSQNMLFDFVSSVNFLFSILRGKNSNNGKLGLKKECHLQCDNVNTNKNEIMLKSK